MKLCSRKWQRVCLRESLFHFSTAWYAKHLGAVLACSDWQSCLLSQCQQALTCRELPAISCALGCTIKMAVCMRCNAADQPFVTCLAFKHPSACFTLYYREDCSAACQTRSSTSWASSQTLQLQARQEHFSVLNTETACHLEYRLGDFQFYLKEAGSSKALPVHIQGVPAVSAKCETLCSIPEQPFPEVIFRYFTHAA